jgi:hypothetical protein
MQLLITSSTIASSNSSARVWTAGKLQPHLPVVSLSQKLHPKRQVRGLPSLRPGLLRLPHGQGAPNISLRPNRCKLKRGLKS